MERLIIESKGITVVVLDTRAIPDDRLTAGVPPPAEVFRQGVREKSALILESEAILANTCVLIWGEAIEKEEAMSQLLAACNRGKTQLGESAWRALLERERQGGTFVGEDVAIPHGRISGINQPLVAFGVGRSGIQDLDSGRSVRIMILLLSPTDKHETHLTMLGLISRMAQDDQWRKKVLGAERPTDVVGLIREMTMARWF